MVEFEELREGVSVDGVYTLERWIRQDGAGTFFTALTGDGERLLIKLAPQGSPGAEKQFAAWERSRHLRHQNLLYIRDVGRSEVLGCDYVYCVFENPDDVLASAIEQGPLSEPETRGVLEAALAALRYLHGQGMVHGAVDANHVVAVDETVKLATDSLRESDDLEGHPEDVRQLGEMLRSLRAPEPLGEPLETIVEHATATDPLQRWTLAEIAAAMDSFPKITPLAPPAPEAVPEAVPEPVPEPIPIQVAMVEAPMPEPQPEAVPPVRLSERNDMGAPSPPPNAPFPKWIIVGVAILLFAILLFNLRRKPNTAPLAAHVAPSAEHVTPTAKAVINAPSLLSDKWRVIAFTYRSRENAAKKAKHINDRWPDLRAMVFAPKQLRGYYLVALGHGMNREEAARVQRKARSLGLPRDTYVQNYSE